MRTMPRSSRSSSASSDDVRNFARDLFLTALRVADVQLELLDVDRRIDVVLHQALGEHDGVFEVVAVPRHERDGDVRAERELPHLGRRAVGEHVAGLHLLALSRTSGRWLIAVSWFVRQYFLSR